MLYDPLHIHVPFYLRKPTYTPIFENALFKKLIQNYKTTFVRHSKMGYKHMHVSYVPYCLV